MCRNAIFSNWKENVREREWETTTGQTKCGGASDTTSELKNVKTDEQPSTTIPITTTSEKM